MHWSDIPRTPPDRTLRQFAALCLVVFGLLSLWQGLGRDNALIAALLAAAALSVGITGLIRPQAIRWIYVGWMMAAFPIGWAISHLVLMLVFFGVITPMAILFRLIGRDALGRRRKACESYWLSRPPAADVRSYFRQS